MTDSMKNFQIKKPLIAGLLAGFFAVALLIASFGVNASTQDGGVIVEDSDVTVQIGSATSSEKAKSISQVQVIGNYKTVSSAKIKVAKDKNRCKTVSGSKAIELGVMTQGYNGSGVGYAPENRTTTMCDTDNNGSYDTRAECGNRLKVTHQSRPNEAKATVWVDDFSNAKAKITANVQVKATAKCETEYASASASARAKASAVAFVQVKTLTGAQGKVKSSELAKVKAKAQANATLEAKAKAIAQVKASANCKSEVIVTPTNPNPPCVDNPNTPENECNPNPPCVDNPSTPKNECHPKPPCKDNPSTPKNECHPKPPCKDNPNTPKDECHPTPPCKHKCHPKPPCKDNPKTPENECHPNPTCKDNPKTSNDECNPSTPPTTSTTICVDDMSTAEDECAAPAPTSSVGSLPDTGPGAIAAVFSVVSAAGAIGYSAFLRRFSQG